MGKQWKQCQTLFLGGSKITADGDCSHEIKRRLLLGRKVMTNRHSIFKSRDITLPTKVHLVKTMVFPVVMYGCESWTAKKAECQRIDAFELWCWRRLLRVRWAARRSNQSILKEINPGISLEGMMLKLKLQYFGHLMQSWLIGKDSDAGRDQGQEEKGMTEDEMAGWHHGLNGCESEWTPGVASEAWRAAIHGVTKSRTRLSDWTELNWTELGVPYSFLYPPQYRMQWYSRNSINMYWHDLNYFKPSIQSTLQFHRVHHYPVLLRHIF